MLSLYNIFMSIGLTTFLKVGGTRQDGVLKVFIYIDIHVYVDIYIYIYIYIHIYKPAYTYVSNLLHSHQLFFVKQISY